MSDSNSDIRIYRLAEKIADEVRLREPDWVSLTEWTRELAQLCASRAEGS